MSEERKEIYSEKISAGSRTYFFDIKEGHDGVKYFVITEARSTKGGIERGRVMIFEENFEEFFASLLKVGEFLGISRNQSAKRSEKIRESHPNAYKKWTDGEDEYLRQSFANGIPIEKLADLLQRQPSAIKSRLIKLGLLS